MAAESTRRSASAFRAESLHFNGQKHETLYSDAESKVNFRRGLSTDSAEGRGFCCHLRKPAPPTGDAEMHSRTLREDVIDFLDLRRESRQKGKLWTAARTGIKTAGLK